MTIKNTRGENIDPAFQFSIRKIESARNSYFLSESHYQLIFMKSGRIRFRAGRADHVLQGPHLVMIPPKINSNILAAPGTEIIQIACSSLFLEQIATRNRDEEFLAQPAFGRFISEQLDSGTEIKIAALDRESEEFTALVSKMLKEYDERKPGYQSIIGLELAELLLLLHSSYLSAAAHKKIKPSATRVEKIIAFIRENYAETFTLKEMADSSGLNPGYLSRAFKEKTGMPVFEYINRIRIQKSCLLLKRSSISILEIAYSVGYNNISFFNRYFRKIMNMSPREYRKFIKK